MVCFSPHTSRSEKSLLISFIDKLEDELYLCGGSMVQLRQQCGDRLPINPFSVLIQSLEKHGDEVEDKSLHGNIYNDVMAATLNTPFPDATDKNNNDFFENYSEKVNFSPPFCFSFFSLLDLSY